MFVKKKYGYLIFSCRITCKGLPSQLRDAVLNSNETSSGYLHESDVSRDYKIQQFLSNKASSEMMNESDAQAEKLLKLVRVAASTRDGVHPRLTDERYAAADDFRVLNFALGPKCFMTGRYF
jgi:predicted metal-binding transcription factor (methanogenesis marker protein 9)